MGFHRNLHGLYGISMGRMTLGLNMDVEMWKTHGVNEQCMMLHVTR